MNWRPLVQARQRAPTNFAFLQRPVFVNGGESSDSIVTIGLEREKTPKREKDDGYCDDKPDRHLGRHCGEPNWKQHS